MREIQRSKNVDLDAAERTRSDMLTDREVFIAAIASIEISGEQAAHRAAFQAFKLEGIGKVRRSRQWSRVRFAIEEIQRIDRYAGEHLH